MKTFAWVCLVLGLAAAAAVIPQTTPPPVPIEARPFESAPRSLPAVPRPARGSQAEIDALDAAADALTRDIEEGAEVRTGPDGRTVIVYTWEQQARRARQAR